MAASSKPNHDVFGLGLGLLSWIFPDVSVWVKVAVSIVVIVLILFLRMDKTKREQTLNVAGNVSETALTNYIVPAIGGGFRGLFISVIGVFIADVILNIHLIHRENFITGDISSSNGGAVSLLLHTLGNLNGAGSALVIIAVCLGAVIKIGEQDTARAELAYRQIRDKKYTTAVLNGTSNFLWITNVKFYFSYNGKTYQLKTYDGRKKAEPGRTKYIVEFSANNPALAKILWDAPVPATGPPAPPGGWNSIPV